MSNQAHPDIAFFGIRHHGPGSARALEAALQEFAPTHLLLESPEEMADAWKWLMEPDMRPPVALMMYVADAPQRSLMLPVAEFSPERVALLHAHQEGLPVVFMDLAARHTLALLEEQGSPKEASPVDPLGWIAEATGDSDGEQWWNRYVEERAGEASVFEHVAELMAMARAERGEPTSKLEIAREACMRQAIRKAVKEPGARVAVVCGAWHVPALRQWKTVKPADDRAILKDLPKVKVSTAWVPWSYDRLAFSSGYGAGVVSPAFYELVWRHNGDELARAWCLMATRLLREQGHPASPAHALEAVRLADALASLRGWSRPGMQELMEAALSVLVEGREGQLRLIEEQLIIGKKVGAVPAHMPGLPLLRDFHQEAKRLKLKVQVEPQQIELDLRDKIGIERSWMFHRCHLLGLFSGRKMRLRGSKGTFREEWEVSWPQDLEVRIVVGSQWGNTVEEAADAFATRQAESAQTLLELTEILEDVLLAKLDRGYRAVLTALESIAAVASDVSQIMAGLPPLARAMRYGDVRETETAALRHAFETLFVRATVGLVSACSQLSEEAAEAMVDGLNDMSQALPLLESDEHTGLWRQAALAAMRAETTHGLVAGRLCALLSGQSALSPEQVRIELGHALDPGMTPARSAAWIEGFLGESGTPLIHDSELFGLVDSWLVGLPEAAFDDSIPLLRRTFSRFTPAERRHIGQRVEEGFPEAAEQELSLDPDRLNLVLPTLSRLLGGDVNVR